MDAEYAEYLEEAEARGLYPADESHLLEGIDDGYEEPEDCWGV